MGASFQLENHGFCTVRTSVPEELLTDLGDSLFDPSRAGERCLLDHPLVRETAEQLRSGLIASGLLEPGVLAIQAIAFDKSAAINWKVAWHQDLMFPFAGRVNTPGFELPCLKNGVHFARPPATVLARLIAVRLHLDDCDAANGPLRVSPGTHVLGILPVASIPDLVSRHGQVHCLARKGEALLMRPVVLHSSSQALSPKHRRVIHFVFHSGTPVDEAWAQSI